MTRRELPEILLQIAIRLFNTVCGAVIGFLVFGFGGYRGLRRLLVLEGLSHSAAVAIMTVAGALLGLIWGKQIWKAIDRQFHGKWDGKRSD